MHGLKLNKKLRKEDKKVNKIKEYKGTEYNFDLKEKNYSIAISAWTWYHATEICFTENENDFNSFYTNKEIIICKDNINNKGKKIIIKTNLSYTQRVEIIKKIYNYFYTKQKDINRNSLIRMLRYRIKKAEQKEV